MLNIKLLRKVALVEGFTLVLLVLVAVPLKRMVGIPEMVSIVGPIHGLAFITYFSMLTHFFLNDRLSFGQWGIGVVAAFIPFGSFIFEHKILKTKED